ncbi:MAG: phosphotransferase [Methyloprofundus sp.]|nr:phosphotransferase [Methyloprofundus sp.]
MNKTEFAHLIPHAGLMSLIDQVESWSDKQIYCTTRSHLAKDNPLRLNDRLSVMHLIEYGAQSMAIHGGLLSGKSSPGYLAAIRGAHFHIQNLDGVQGVLHIKAEAELKIENGAVYSFHIFDEQDHLLLDARATVIHT